MIVSCSSSDLYLRRFLPLPSQVAPMTGFRRRSRISILTAPFRAGICTPFSFQLSDRLAYRKDTGILRTFDIEHSIIWKFLSSMKK